MLNLVIAILSNTYEKYDKIANGLYYDVLMHVFPVYAWDETYGFIPCAQTPFNMLLTVFTPIMFIASSCGVKDKGLQKLNYIFTSILYFPNAVLIFIVF